MALRVNTDDFDEQVLQSDKLVIADFYSDGCVPCKILSPTLADVEDELTDKIKAVKVNINFASDLSEKYQVKATPTLVFFKNGEEVARRQGVVKKDEIIEIVNDNI